MLKAMGLCDSGFLIQPAGKGHTGTVVDDVQRWQRSPTRIVSLLGIRLPL